jgi:hypothetical protein
LGIGGQKRVPSLRNHERENKVNEYSFGEYSGSLPNGTRNSIAMQPIAITKNSLGLR